MRIAAAASLLALLALAPPPARAAAAPAAAAGEDVDVTAGVVTGLSCALRARDHGELKALTSCPPAEAARGLVVYDVAEQRIYRLDGKKVFRFELESAFGGGSIDFAGKTTKVDAASRVATVAVQTYSLTRKPKPGAFKGCL